MAEAEVGGWVGDKERHQVEGLSPSWKSQQ